MVQSEAFKGSRRQSIKCLRKAILRKQSYQSNLETLLCRAIEYQEYSTNTPDVNQRILSHFIAMNIYLKLGSPRDAASAFEKLLSEEGSSLHVIQVLAWNFPPGTYRASIMSVSWSLLNCCVSLYFVDRTLSWVVFFTLKTDSHGSAMALANIIIEGAVLNFAFVWQIVLFTHTEVHLYFTGIPMWDAGYLHVTGFIEDTSAFQTKDPPL